MSLSSEARQRGNGNVFFPYSHFWYVLIARAAWYDTKIIFYKEDRYNNIHNKNI